MIYQIIGDIALFKSINKKQAEVFLKKNPRFKTICLQGEIKGKYRLPKIKVLAGDGTETIHKESDCLFKLDVSKIMWSKGNFNERRRIAEQVKNGEIVIDCFAGIGYFSIPIAKASKAKQVYAIELNPTAFKYLEENIRMNRLANIIAIQGDCAKEIKKLSKADRIIMGLLPSAKKYIKPAISRLKKGGIIHYHGIAKDGKELLKDFGKAKIKLLKITKVKEYKPRMYHFVLDIKVA